MLGKELEVPETERNKEGRSATISGWGTGGHLGCGGNFL